MSFYHYEDVFGRFVPLGGMYLSLVFLLNDLLGGEDRFGNKQNTILQFIPENMNWKKIGTTLMVRSCHAVAVVKITNDNYNQYCVQKE